LAISGINGQIGSATWGAAAGVTTGGQATNLLGSNRLATPKVEPPQRQDFPKEWQLAWFKAVGLRITARPQK
jgi:hypothetical protein